MGPGVALIDGREACGSRKGDSGLGSDGLDLLNCGLGARPGPKDWLKFGRDGVGGVYV